jgi:hypothetical protein
MNMDRNSSGLQAQRECPLTGRSDSPRRKRTTLPGVWRVGLPGRSTACARATPYEDASAMCLATISIVRPSSSVGLNSTTSVPA